MSLRVCALLVVSVMGCTQHAAGSSTTGPAGASVPKLLEFERTGCYGHCRSYELVLFENGRLRYRGTFEVADRGPVEVSVAPSTMVTIRAIIGRLSALPPDCCDCTDVTDAPSVNLRFALPSGVKTIAHYHGCKQAPDWVFAAENSIDQCTARAQG